MFVRRIHSPLAALMLLAACGSDHPVIDPGGPRDYSLQREGANVAVTPVYRYCSADTDCALVNVTCNGCCDRDAIAASLTDEYRSAHEDACEGYSGGVCDCAPESLRAVCVDGSSGPSPCCSSSRKR